MPRLVSPAVLAAVLVAPVVALGFPTATAAPGTDEFGYVDSTARCAAPNTPVIFGATSASRVAVCKAADGELQYRGVRIADGAKLFLTATRSDDGSYRATNDGIGYVVTPKALTVSSAGKTVRQEPWVDVHGPATGTPSPTPAARTPAPSPPTPSPLTPAPPPAPADQPSATAPLPPPLPAEVGHR